MTNKTAKKPGSLEVICGPMFSGKSEELIRRLRRAKIAKQNVAVFKPAIDTRYQLESITSHNGSKLDAHAIDDSSLIMQHVEKHNYTVVGIDEVQFFARDIVAVICALTDKRVRVLAAGLDLDFRGIPFGPIPTLLAIADKITKRQAICTVCGNDAIYTQRFVNNKPAQYHDPIVLVGAQETYDARCRNCYHMDKPSNYMNQLQSP